MTRIEEINGLLKMLELTHKVVTSDDAKRSEVVEVVDFLRNAAFNLVKERETLEAQAKSEQDKAKTIEPEVVSSPSIG